MVVLGQVGLVGERVREGLGFGGAERPAGRAVVGGVANSLHRGRRVRG